MDLFKKIKKPITGSSFTDKDASSDLKNLTVLYVEDNQDVRSQLSLFLKRRFARVLVAHDGAEGLRLYTQESTPPDLVISDIRMPGMDGLEMAEHIKSLNPQQPIIMTTAHEETDYLLKAIDLGVDKFILKPVEARQLHSTLLHLAEQLEARKQLEAARRALEASEARYRTLFWTAMDALCIFSWRDLQILEVNRQHQVLFDHSFREVEGDSLTRLFHQQDFNEVRKLLETSSNQQEVMLVNLQKACGDAFPAEMAVACLTNSDQELGLLTTRDASDRLTGMEEQEALVEVLEMTINALDELSQPQMPPS
ncbi:response regulator [Marinospirillum sp.]|uniref:response regulator n=1 Tax=Marinospirillum sp. TaxID=2183934 RepID=UPI00384BFA8C